MKIVFFDIDDTASTLRTSIARGDADYDKSVDPIIMGLLNRLLEIEPGTKVVINSAWSTMHTRDEVLKVFQGEGFVGEFHSDWCTPGGGEKGDNVNRWLKRNPEITTYVCIDDGGTYYSDQPFVQVSGRNGMMIEDLYQAADILYGDKNPWRSQLEYYVEHGIIPKRPNERPANPRLKSNDDAPVTPAP